MISNLVNPLFHCNSQYSWYKGLKAIGMTGRRKKLTRTFPEPWSRSNAFSQMWASDRRKGFPYGTCVKVVFHLLWFLWPDMCYKETQRVKNMVPGHKMWWWRTSRDVTKWPQDWLSPVNHWSIIEPGGVTQIWSKSSPHSKTLHTHQWKL